jgi:acyl-coenzyme A thioesterase PaaI-like protein
MYPPSIDDHVIVKKAMRAIALNRTPGYSFCGNFFDFSYDSADQDHSIVHVKPEAQSTGSNGQIHIVVQAILADMGLATCLRYNIGDRHRTATVSLSLQFTGVEPCGDLVATSHSQAHLQGVQGRQGISQTRLTSGDALVAIGTAAFMIMPMPQGTILPPVPWVSQKPPDNLPLDLQSLNETESWILERVRQSVIDSEQGGQNFLAHFLTLDTQPTSDGAICNVENGPHIGNRVGHVQGGIILAIGMVCATAALGDEWLLSGVTATYISPGEGETVRAQSVIVHQGRMTAVVKTSVKSGSGKTALEVLSTHARRA